MLSSTLADLKVDEWIVAIDFRSLCVTLTFHVVWSNSLVHSISSLFGIKVLRNVPAHWNTTEHSPVHPGPSNRTHPLKLQI